MTREEAIKQLIEEQKSYDTEHSHSMADDILCELLISLGHGDVVKEYEKIDKWYA